MTHREDLLTPVGRLVMGSLYEPQTTDPEGNPLLVKTGVNAGKPQVRYFFAIAIPKSGEQHWSQTPWGALIWNVGHLGFPNGQAQSPTFAWKIVNGDSQEPNRRGVKPCDRQGYPGHWVLSFSSGFEPQIVRDRGSKIFNEKSAISLGDYIEVFGSVSDNASQQQPGVFLNHTHVNFVGYGERIIVGVDPKDVGFTGALPAGASITPLSSGFVPLTPPAVPQTTFTSPSPLLNNVTSLSVPVMQPVSPALNNVPPPYTQILTPPAPAPAQRVMLPAANGLTYEQYKAGGWSDIQLIQHGYMAP